MIKDVIFFGYSWAAERSIDHYQQGLVDALSKLSCNIHVFPYADFCSHGSVRGFNQRYSVEKMSQSLQALHPQLIVCMNNAGLFKTLIEDFKEIPILNIIVDEADHLFIPDGDSLECIFNKNIKHILTNSESLNAFENIAPISAHSRLHFMPCCTDNEPVGTQVKYDISFVGTYLPNEQIIELLARAKGEQILENLEALLSSLNNNFKADIEKLIDKFTLRDFIERQFENTQSFRVQALNYLSSNLRLDVANKLAPHGLTIFGNPLWLEAIADEPQLLEKFQDGGQIRSRAQLNQIYNESKISVHISQLQVQGALSYRVFDILKSKALLIMPYAENSDLFRVFGEDCPILMYKNTDELKSLCEYYLNNEGERLKKLAECHKLVETGFHFEDRVKEYLSLCDLSYDAEIGYQKIISTEDFVSTKAHVKKLIPYRNLLRKIFMK